MHNRTLDLRRLYFLGLALAVLLTAGTAVAQEAPIKIAVVDLDSIVAQSPAGRALQARLEGFQQEIQREVEKLSNQAREIRQRIAEGANSLSEDKLVELQRQYEGIEIDLRRFRDDKQREGQKMQTEGLREIERQLAPVFKAVQQEMGLDLILNNTPGVVVLAGQRADITQIVLDKLNGG